MGREIARVRVMHGAAAAATAVSAAQRTKKRALVPHSTRFSSHTASGALRYLAVGGHAQLLGHYFGIAAGN